MLSVALPQSLTFKGKMTTSLKFKEKATELDTRSYKCLLLALVKLIHADPKLMLHVSPPQHPCQNDSAAKNNLFLRCFCSDNFSCTQVLMHLYTLDVFTSVLFFFMTEMGKIHFFFFFFCVCCCVLEPSEASSRDAEQHSRAHHWPGAASASYQHHPALTGSHGGQRQTHPFSKHTPIDSCCYGRRQAYNL